MRVYELAKELQVTSRDILMLLEEMGVGGKTASSSVPDAYLGKIRARFGRGVAPETAEAAPGKAPKAAPGRAPRAAPGKAPRAVPSAAPGAEAVAPPGGAPSVAAPSTMPESAEEQADTITLKAPLTVTGLATAVDTDAENVITAAAGLGETITVDDLISPELALLIGEQWGYTVRIQQPEVVEEEKAEAPPAPVSTVTVEEAPAEVVAKEAEAAEEEAPPAPPLRVVPRRTAPPDAPARPPVVTVMGHVDHGKTSLLDAIRETNVTAQEAGSITQHIGAYQVEVKGKTITFIDTPGHEAFTAMRARGAQVTDIAVLVVAADDGVMPQTIEAIDHAQAAGVPIVVVVNKMDRPNAAVDPVKQRLAEKNLVPEEWGGETIYVPVSALERTGIDNLLETILLVAEMSELRADRDKPAEGVVLEAELDKRRGGVATLLVQEGILRVGDSLAVGPVSGKARAMTDERGRRVKEASPSTPVQVIGLSDVPEASELFRVVKSDREARALAEEHRLLAREAEMRAAGPRSMAELSQLFAAGEAKDLNLILKGDAQGTVEAIRGALEALRVEEVKANVLHTGVGDVTESDVSLAAATKPTIIIGFQVSADTQARRLAADEQVEIERYDVIYDLLDDIRRTMAGMLEAVYEEAVVGRAEVRAVFRSSRVGTIAGCYVLEGRIARGAKLRVRRGGDVVFEGTLDSLRHLKDDVREMSEGYECGIALGSFSDFAVGDVIECIEEREVQRAVL